jgi:hypothetical protein
MAFAPQYQECHLKKRLTVDLIDCHIHKPVLNVLLLAQKLNKCQSDIVNSLHEEDNNASVHT